MPSGQIDGERDNSPERRRSSASVDDRAINKAKEIAAEAKEIGFQPLPLERLKDSRPPTRTTTAFVEKLPPGQTRRSLTPLSVLDMFFCGEINLWKSIARSTNSHIRSVMERGQHLAYGPTVTSSEVRMVFFLRMEMTLHPGKQLKQNYLYLHLERWMSYDRFIFVSSQAHLDPDICCELIRYCQIVFNSLAVLSHFLQVQCTYLLPSRIVAGTRRTCLSVERQTPTQNMYSAQASSKRFLGLSGML